MIQRILDCQTIRVAALACAIGLTPTTIAEESEAKARVAYDDQPGGFYVLVEAALYQEKPQSFVGDGAGYGVGVGYSFYDIIAVEATYRRARGLDSEPAYRIAVYDPDAPAREEFSYEPATYASVAAVITPMTRGNMSLFVSGGYERAKSSTSLVAVEQAADVSGESVRANGIRYTGGEYEDDGAVVGGGVKVRMGETGHRLVLSYTRHFAFFDSESVNAAWEFHF